MYTDSYTFHCFLHLETSAKADCPIETIAAVYTDEQFNVLSEYQSQISQYQQKQLGYEVLSLYADDFADENTETINDAYNVIVTLNGIEQVLVVNKETETDFKNDAAKVIYWHDSRLDHIGKYNDLIVRLSKIQDFDPWFYVINKFNSRCYYTLTQKMPLVDSGLLVY